MNSSYTAVCVSINPIPDLFKSELVKIFKENNLLVQEMRPGTFLKYHLEGRGFQEEILQNSLVNLSSLYQVDIGFFPKKLFEAQKKLILFDMDSTLITSEVIDEMALKYGVGDKVKMITAKAMNGELDFNQSLAERVKLLKGFPRKHMDVILKSLIFTPGTKDFLKVLKSHGIKTVIATGGFEYFAKHIQSELNIDHVFANSLVFKDDLLTGEIDEPIINAAFKENAVLELAKKENLSLDQVVAIGDGANDIPMLLKAGLGIAIHAKEKVQRSARFRINHGPMTTALTYMNMGEAYEAL